MGHEIKESEQWERNSASSFPMSPPHCPIDERGVCSSSCSDQDTWHIFPCAVCSQAASSLWASALAFLIYTGTDQSKHSPCQSCSSASVAEPQGKHLQSRLCHTSPAALQGLWFLSLPLPLRVSHSSAPNTGQVQVVPLAPHGSAPCCACRGVQGEELAPQSRSAAGWALPITPVGPGEALVSQMVQKQP